MFVSTRVSLTWLSILAGTIAALGLMEVRFFAGVRLRPEGLPGAGFDLVVVLGSVMQGFSTTHGLIGCVSWAWTWQAPNTKAPHVNTDQSHTFFGRDFTRTPVLFA